MTFPTGACDTHVHIYDDTYPIAPATVLTPPDSTLDEYRELQVALGLERVVLVQPTTYGFDNSCQIDAAAELAHAARLVVVVDHNTPGTELERLDRLGARGARFHMLPGGAVGWDALAPTAELIADLGWHVQLQMDGNLLPDRLDQLLALPAPLVIDHVGRFMPPPPADSPAFAALLRLIDTGRTWVKLSAPYEATHDGAPHYPSVTALVDRLVAHAPERLLWASNWPHPGQPDPLTVEQVADLAERWLPTDDLRRRVLVDNPAHVYGFPAAPTNPQTELPGAPS